MNYDYRCNSCNAEWEESQFLNDRDLPTEEPCPHCKEMSVKRVILKAPRVSYSGAVSNLKRAGSGWNDVLTGIKKASGKNSTIETR